jgi:mono/diheme cytochrome c family protein
MMRAVVVVVVLAVSSLALAADLEAGRALYDRYCAGCHGASGDGAGPAAAMLLVKPRDFTKGTFKFRSTPAGTLPTDADLFRTITQGVHRTSMPEWVLLPERERWALVAVVKSFFPEWEQRGAGTAIPMPAAPNDLAGTERVARGRTVYETLDCGTCHGVEGKGDGPSAKTLPPDAWGNPQKPFNFTKGKLKGGGAPEDVYRTFMTGLNGTAMPSFYDIFAEPDGEYIKPGDAWNLVAYVRSLRTKGAP